MRRIRLALLATLSLMALGFASASFADVWRGTAPFCDGKCLGGEQTIGRSDYGDGGYCVTGHKVLCRGANTNPSCKPQETKTNCYGVVMVCENGFHESLNQVWHTCNSYACGVCVGLSIDSVHPQSTGGGQYRADVCKGGYVWREAVKDDHVCVPPATRSQAAADNRAAESRKQPGGGASGPDTCKQGYVWREATANDHVCVLPATRQAARDDNRQAAARVAPPPTQVFNDTCRQGFVWREAIKDDHVCVTPQTRSQAATDNQLAASRRAGAGPNGPDTCRPGFVWREVVPSDHVCVSPAVRDAARNDTAQAGQRLASR